MTEQIIMKRNFDKWNKRKIMLDAEARKPLFHEREIWWCAIGANLGFEQDGKHDNFERPILILRKYSANLFFGLPLTSVERKGKFYFEINYGGKYQNGYVILSQGRTLSPNRLLRKIHRIGNATFQKILKKHNELLIEKRTFQKESPRVPNGNL
jgi:mRNA interferase MazF